MRVFLSAALLAMCASVGVAQITFGVQVAVSSQTTLDAVFNTTTDGVELISSTNQTVSNKVLGEFVPTINGVPAPLGSIVDVLLTARATAGSNTASAKVDGTIVQNGRTPYSYVHGGTPRFFEVSNRLFGQPGSPAISRVAIRVTKVTPPTFIPDLTLSGPLTVGSSRTLYLNRPADAGLDYMVAATLSTTPGIQIGNRVIPANVDPLFVLSRRDTPFFGGFTGKLDQNGVTFFPRVSAPSLALIGKSFFLTYVTLQQSLPAGIKSIAPAKRFTVLP